jgi:hypothetical protein
MQRTPQYSDRQTDGDVTPLGVTTHAKNIRYLRQQPIPAPRAATDEISGWPGGA